MDCSSLYRALDEAGAAHWTEQLPQQIALAFDTRENGTLQKWRKLISEIEIIEVTEFDFLNQVSVGRKEDLHDGQRKKLEQQLKELRPWRKGPYDVFGINIDTEWRSDWKWDRLKTQIHSLQGRKVLDIGCGNGYHCWRMFGAGAELVLGVDPTMLSVLQFHMIHKLTGSQAPVFVLPLGIEDLPDNIDIFDTVFSMGVLYHRRSPIDHLLQLKACIRPGGELVLETLVIDGGPGEVLLPPGRYAQMRNVWFIPTCETLRSWMCRCGFSDIKLVNVSKTSFAEQRRTEWMQSYSLENFLDPDDPNLTCEGLPAPVRAIFTATV
jgi:tRNA (mo5U34)-methyltransferase